MRWDTWNSPVVAALALCAWIGCGAPTSAPSIAIVTLDTLRRDHVGAYSDPSEMNSSEMSSAESGQSLTPHLDALAAEGLLHEAAYTTMPTTGPAHISAFTGLYPSQHGATRNGEPLGMGQAPRELARRLRARGYATAAFVTSELAGREATGLGGFEVYDGPRGTLRSGHAASQAALAWVEAETRRPIFVWLHLYDAHSPYGDLAQKRRGYPIDWDLYGWVDPTRFADPDARARMARRYAKGVRLADSALGSFVNGLRESLPADPLWIVTSDHGESLDEHLDDRVYGYDHGEFLDPESVVIPLVLAGAGVTPGRSARTASLRDIYTTVLRAAGDEGPDAQGEDGVDLRTPASGRRMVGIERRSFFKRQRPMVRAQAGAAADGIHLVIVGEDGTAVPGASEAPDDLTALARQHAEAATIAGRRPASAISGETREALRNLGYAE